MHQNFIQRFEAAGFHYKSSESPEIWTHLESHFTNPSPLGPRFDRFPASRMAEMIAYGETILLDALMDRLQRTGKPCTVTEVIEMPYIVGISGMLPRSAVDPARILHLVEHPGTVREHIVEILPTEAGSLPGTHHMTVTGGLYADGHTAGYYDLSPGMPLTGANCVYLSTAADILSLTQEMHDHIEDVSTISRAECEKMLALAEKFNN